MFELLFINPSLINYTYILYSLGTQNFELKIKYNNRLMSFFVVSSKVSSSVKIWRAIIFTFPLFNEISLLFTSSFVLRSFRFLEVG